MRAISIATLVVLFVGCRSVGQHSPAHSHCIAAPVAADLATLDGDSFQKLGIAVKDGSPDLSDVIIRLSRPDCEIRLSVFGAGDSLAGEFECKYVNKLPPQLGLCSSQSIPPTDVIPILKVMEDLDFMNMKHDCRWSIVDSPYAATSLSIGKRVSCFTTWIYARERQPQYADEIAFHDRYEALCAAIHQLGDLGPPDGLDDSPFGQDNGMSSENSPK